MKRNKPALTYDCPNCGGKDTMTDAIMPEEGVNYPIVHCDKCGWWQ